MAARFGVRDLGPRTEGVMESALLIGNSFAVLVAAFELANRGKQVTLLTDGKQLGGHFAGIKIQGVNFDIGMVFFEETVPPQLRANLSGYDASIRNDWTRFGDYASNWIREQVELIRVPSPECILEGRILPDYLISNRVDAFAGALPPSILGRHDSRHAANKNKGGVYDKVSYAEAAKWNHGTELHERFIEPFVGKVLGVKSDEFLARYHRVAWVPLYYPETLRSALNGQSINIPEYPFWTTRHGHVGHLIERLQGSLAQLKNVEIVNEPLRSLGFRDSAWSAVVMDGRSYGAYQLALGLTPERASSLLDIFTLPALPAASVQLLFALVPFNVVSKRHGCTLIVDEEYATYRLTDQDAIAGLDPDWHRIVLEASPQHTARLYPELDEVTALRGELATLLGMNAVDASSIRVLRCFTATNALPIPTSDQVARSNRFAADVALAAPNAAFTGSLLGFGVASFNDQLVQGLKIAKEFL